MTDLYQQHCVHVTHSYNMHQLLFGLECNIWMTDWLASLMSLEIILQCLLNLFNMILLTENHKNLHQMTCAFYKMNVYI